MVLACEHGKIFRQVYRYLGVTDEVGVSIHLQ